MHPFSSHLRRSHSVEHLGAGYWCKCSAKREPFPGTVHKHCRRKDLRAAWAGLNDIGMHTRRGKPRVILWNATAPYGAGRVRAQATRIRLRFAKNIFRLSRRDTMTK